MVIHDLDIAGTLVRPDKADTPLVINSDAVLPFTVAFQCFKVVPGRRCHVLQLTCRIELVKLAPCNGFDVDETSHSYSLMQQLGAAAFEGRDRHVSYRIPCIDMTQVGCCF